MNLVRLHPPDRRDAIELVARMIANNARWKRASRDKAVITITIAGVTEEIGFVAYGRPFQ